MKEKLFSMLWGGAGVLLVGCVSTIIDNKTAVASLESKVIEVDELGEKMDRVAIQLTDVSGRIVGMRADIQKLEADLERRD